MEINILKEEKNMLLIELKGDTIGFANLIREELWNDKNVEEAASIKEHPYMAEPKIFVKTKEGKPQKALQESIKRLQSNLKELKKELESSLKK
ncbi:MAG: DNA-directed RNA polymerase subunit L [Candidatus Aenigmarchaeota archaeon]|nr:DNA-directed RNA polymerase subunit L [Candidatus Aenigmarchaeota archaeon]